MSGQIGGGDDGGIDGFFIFVNRININEDTDIESLSKNPEIELFLIQSKRSSSFSEGAVEHIIATSKDIFNLEKDISDFEKFYNSILIDKVNIFRQTYLKLASNTIYNYLKDKDLTASKQEDRAVLIKIVVTTDTEDRDRVIKATNFQTAIPVASLKATERIQSDIENYFLSKNWFYDRRKNYYKNMGKPSNKIVSILYLAQAVMAIVLIEPDVARARPSSIIKKDSDYKRVFKSSFKMDMYLFCAKTMKQVDLFISSTIANQCKNKDEKQWFHTSTLRYVSFHLAMLIIIKLLGKTDYKVKDVETLLEVDLSSNPEIMCQTLSELIELTNVYLNSRPSLSISTLFKQKEFVKYLLDNVNCSVG